MIKGSRNRPFEELQRSSLPGLFSSTYCLCAIFERERIPAWIVTCIPAFEHHVNAPEHWALSRISVGWWAKLLRGHGNLLARGIVRCSTDKQPMTCSEHERFALTCPQSRTKIIGKHSPTKVGNGKESRCREAKENPPEKSKGEAIAANLGGSFERPARGIIRRGYVQSRGWKISRG